MDFNGKHLLILGLGETGLSMARHLAAQGATLRVADTRAQPPGLEALVQAIPGAEVACGPLQERLFEGVDAVAVSPGVPVSGPLADPLVVAAIARGLPFMGDIELFALALAAEQAASGYSPKVLAVTGTNGKTTVTVLAALLAQKAGKRAVAAGNISPAALDAWRDARAAASSAESPQPLPDVWVLELSSYQLETMHSLKPAAAVMLNLSEDHLDRHGSMQAYGAAKARIFMNGGIQILNRDDAASMAMRRPFDSKKKKDVPPVVLTFGAGAPQAPTDYGLVREARSGGLTWLAEGSGMWSGAGVGASAGMHSEDAVPNRLMPLEVLRIKGQHNATNALAALALNRAIGLPLAPMLKALRDYAGEPHRVQPVATVGWVQYIDDSKGTNVGATLAALQGLGAELRGDNRIVLIAGGEGKGQDFAPLAGAVRATCRAVLLIGRDAPRLREALAGCGVELVDAGSLEAAVPAAARLAQAGDIVLLSPACASFDMFRNYAHRAEVFVGAVRELGRAGEPRIEDDLINLSGATDA
jgi:UDP-N-acetylmuramoylalanine--D-glutamate ligase